MNALSLEESYSLLNVNAKSTDEEIARSYRALAIRYHPDKNRDKIEWATRIMSRINSAYTIILSSRFQKTPAAESNESKAKGAREEGHGQNLYEQQRRKREEELRANEEERATQASISRFRIIREDAKDALYRFFQFNLYNIARREIPSNISIFRDIVSVLRRCYHSIEELIKISSDDEVIQHLTVFRDMIFNFYRAAECLNVPDHYKNVIDVEAFRLYRKGEESLHQSHREVFYTRHNRGNFDMDNSLAYARNARVHFIETINLFPDSSWTVEAGIKLEYTDSLIAYILLFFNED